MDTTTRWALNDSPVAVRFKKIGEKVHPEVKHWFELTQLDVVRCLMIKQVVKQLLPNAKLYLFGSRINGRWTEESDYDIVVLWMATPKERETLQGYNYGFKVDMRFAHSYNAKNAIEI